MLGRDTEVDIQDTAWTQPTLFVFEYAMTQLWGSWGVKPSILAGHSIGELVAACIAGVFSLDDALKVVARGVNAMRGPARRPVSATARLFAWSRSTTPRASPIAAAC